MLPIATLVDTFEEKSFKSTALELFESSLNYSMAHNTRREWTVISSTKINDINKNNKSVNHFELLEFFESASQETQ